MAIENYNSVPVANPSYNQETLVGLINGLSPVININVISTVPVKATPVNSLLLVNFLILSFGRAIAQKMIDVENNNQFMLAFNEHAKSKYPQPNNNNKADLVKKAANDFMEQINNAGLDQSDLMFLTNGVISTLTPVLSKMQQMHFQPNGFQNIMGQPPVMFGNQFPTMNPSGSFQMGQCAIPKFMNGGSQIQNPEFITNMYNTAIRTTGAHNCFADFLTVADNVFAGEVPAVYVQKISQHLLNLGGIINDKPDVTLNMCFLNLVKIMKHTFEGNPQFIIDGNNIIICQ